MINSMKKSIIFFIILAAALAAIQVDAYTFTKTLRFGDRNSEVLELQKVLNSDPDTQVSVSGAGSPGKETSYFGGLTRKALAKFQVKHKTDITRHGYYIADGSLGRSTRNYINTLNISPAPAPVIAETKLPLRVFNISELKTAPGRQITIIGGGFDDTKNTVHIGDGVTLYDQKSAKNNTEITIILPSTVNHGTHRVWVDTPIDSTKNAGLAASIIVSNTAVPKPKIDKISLSAATINDTITITGTGFTQTNTLYSTLGHIQNVSSPDGQTITFKVSDLPKASGLNVSAVIPVSINIGNENGASASAATFRLKK